jgi:DNA-binding beta-propeller fold protein YncE
MSKARDLANLIASGNVLADGGISVSDISDLSASAEELNYVDGVTSALQTQLNNISVTSGSLTKTFIQNETADITLSQGITSAPVVSATKEVPQTGVSTKGNWDVNSTASNYDFHNTAANVTLTPTSVSSFANTSNAANSFAQSSSAYNSEVGGAYPSGFAWAGNGMYYYIANGKNIYRYELTTAYDLTTASLSSGQSFNNVSVWNQDIDDLYVNNSGTQLFTVHGNHSKYVARFTMSTGHDLANLSYSNNVNLQNHSGNTLAIPTSVTFKPDGLVMYVTDFNSAIFSYSINPNYPFNMSYVTGQTGAEGFGSELSSSTGVRGSAFTSDGTKMYILDDSTDKNIVEYSLSTAWDITTKSYTGNSFHFKPLLATHLDNVPSLTLINDNAFVILDNNSAKVRKIAFGSSNSLVLGSGSFASTDVGKRIVGNGGDVILTSTAGAFDATGGSAFTDSSTIAAGSWSMFGLKSAGDASGITISGNATSGNYTALDTTDGHTHKVTLGSTNASGLQGFTIDPNGLYLFAVSAQDDRVKRYDFGTAWDLSTLNTTATSGQEINTSSRDGNMVDVAFNSSGTKMFVAGQDNDRIYQWNLSTAWDLSTASYYDNHSVSGTNYVSGGFNGIFVTPNDASIYTVCRNSDRVAKWNFSASGHINGISIDGTVSVSSQNSYPFDVAWSPDGSAMYLSGNNNGFYKYNPAGNYSLSGISHDSSFSVTVGTNAVESFFIKPDETKVYTMINNQISEWNIGTVTQPTSQYHVGVTNSGGRIDSSNFVDINGMTAAESAGTGTAHYAVSTDGRTTWSVAKGTSGVRPIVRNNSGTWQYNSDNVTSSSFALSGATYSGDAATFSTSGQDGQSYTVAAKPDGTKIYVASYNSDNVYQYDLSTAFDLSTASYNNINFSFNSQMSNPRGIHFKPDGTEMYLMNQADDTIYQYTMSTAWDLSSASYSGYSFATSVTNNTYGLYFKSDGTKLYISDGGSSDQLIYEHDLSTAWRVSTASYNSKILNARAQMSSVLTSFAINPTGTKVHAYDYGSRYLYEYDLSTAWDMSTASYNNVSVSLDPNPSAAGYDPPSTIHLDYTSGYLYAMRSERLFEWSGFVTTTLPYSTTATWANGTVNDELYTLQQALSLGNNRMDKTQLDAIPDANHFATGTSLDLMIALRMDTGAATLPTSDGVTLNYDAAALNEGAVLGTDYDFFFPSSTKVQIKSLAAQNLKVRVV